MRTFLTALLILTATSFSYGQQSIQEKKVTETLNKFHQAIVENNKSEAGKLLADSAQILEGGKIETKEEYLSHHFHLDGKFLSAMNREVVSQTVSLEGNTAWVSTKTYTSGTYNEQEIKLNSLELAVLSKTKEGWKISALHWSSSNK